MGKVKQTNFFTDESSKENKKTKSRSIIYGLISISCFSTALL